MTGYLKSFLTTAHRCRQRSRPKWSRALPWPSTLADGRVALWDPAQTADPLERLELSGPLATLSWRPDGRAPVAGGRDGVLTALDCSAMAEARWADIVAGRR